MKLKLLHTCAITYFYINYFAAKRIKHSIKPVLRYDTRFYIGNLENTTFTDLNVELKRLI